MNPSSVLALMEVAVLVQDRGAHVLFANPAARDLFGLVEAEPGRLQSIDPECRVYAADDTLIAPDDFPAAIAIRTGQPVRDVVVGIDRPFGADRAWTLLSSFPRTGQGGEVEDVLSVMTDISRELAALGRLTKVNQSLEQMVASSHARVAEVLTALRASESVHRSTIHAMSEGVVVLDPAGRLVTANAAATRILGLSVDEMLGRHPLDPEWQLTRPDGSPLPVEEVPSEVTRRTGQSIQNARLGLRLRSGKRAWLSVNTVPVRLSEDSDDHGVVGTFTDITEAIEIANDLDAHRQQLEQITSAVPGVIYQHLVADDGTESFPFVSEQLAAIVGLDRLPGRDDAEPIYGLIHPEDRDRLRAAVRKATSLLDRADPATTTAALVDEEVRLLTRTGETRFVHLRSSAVRRPGGYLFNGFLQDVTERARMSEQLRVAQRKEVLGELAAGFAHNFNNMLAAILPNLERARRETTGELHLEIEDAHQAATSAAELVRQLMLMVRREDPLARESIDLAAVSREVIRICRRTFDRRLAINERIPDRPIIVRARRGELQQVLLNLCLNARDASEATAEPRIEISVTEADDADRVTFAVADNGSGMSDEVRRRAGEPFFTTKPPGRGTGLGLATAIGILDDLGGALDFESGAGAGSIFRISLPTIPGGALREASESPLVTTTEFAGLRALVIDDEALVRQVVARMLRQLGFVAATAADGAEGLARLEAGERFAVAIVDLSMPGMSGAAVLDAIQRHWPELPVVISSGNLSSEVDLTKAAATLQKPYLLPELQAALRTVLVRHPGTGDGGPGRADGSA